MQLFARDALLPGGWARDVHLQWSAQGQFTRVDAGAARPAGVAASRGPVIPGMPNLHSHAFQHGFAGLAEYRAREDDSFWSWRESMYRFAARITPDALEAVATHLYIRMLHGGYTSVCEFHYLHHDGDGRPYADDATMSRCLLRAARRAGIGITLLPVLYQCAGFGAVPSLPEQRRFLRSTESLLGLIGNLCAGPESPGERIGFAAHSLRAVPALSLQAALAGLDAIDSSAPIHLHIAEQQREVDECVAWSGQRPVGWLLDHAHVDERWCLVHATHLSPQETVAAARTGAVAGLCPTTEANLGDGTFDAVGWMAAAGKWGIGSDSHVCVNAAEELMALEYSQRLLLQRRNVLASPRDASVAAAMTQAAVAGGAQACGRQVAGVAVGQQADFVVLDDRHPALAGLRPDAMLSAHVFASDRTSAIHDVHVAGNARIVAGLHRDGEDATARFVAARAAMLAQD